MTSEKPKNIRLTPAKMPRIHEAVAGNPERMSATSAKFTKPLISIQIQPDECFFKSSAANKANAPSIEKTKVRSRVSVSKPGIGLATIKRPRTTNRIEEISSHQ